jgi:hypothetical protein
METPCQARRMSEGSACRPVVRTGIPQQFKRRNSQDNGSRTQRGDTVRCEIRGVDIRHERAGGLRLGERRGVGGPDPDEHGRRARGPTKSAEVLATMTGCPSTTLALPSVLRDELTVTVGGES